jgi:hypothetical protein
MPCSRVHVLIAQWGRQLHEPCGRSHRIQWPSEVSDWLYDDTSLGVGLQARHRLGVTVELSQVYGRSMLPDYTAARSGIQPTST